MPELVVRDAAEADWPAVLDIYNQSIPAGLATADTEPVTLESRLAWFRAFDPARRPLWVAECGGEVVGWVGLTSFYAGRPAYRATAEVSLYVATAHHRTGVGGRLMRAAVAACPRLGVTTLAAFQFDHNPASAGLTRKFGFEPAGHLADVAVVNGVSVGLVISLLRVPPAGG